MIIIPESDVFLSGNILYFTHNDCGQYPVDLSNARRRELGILAKYMSIPNYSIMDKQTLARCIKHKLDIHIPVTLRQYITSPDTILDTFSDLQQLYISSDLQTPDNKFYLVRHQPGEILAKWFYQEISANNMSQIYDLCLAIGLPTNYKKYKKYELVNLLNNKIIFQEIGS